METLPLTNAITVMGKKGTKVATAVAMDPSEGKKFVANVKDAFHKLSKLSTGAALIRAIGESGRQCTIFCATDAGAAMPNPQDIGNNLARMMKSFRRQHHNMTHNSQKTELHRKDWKNEEGKWMVEKTTVKHKGFLGMKSNLANMNTPQARWDAALELDVVLMRAWKNIDKGRSALAFLLGKSLDDIDEVRTGAKKLTDSEYFKIAFAYYEHMTPGPGCDTQVKVQFKVAIGNPKAKDKPKLYPFKPKTDWECVAAEVMLGHELIHAWRMMTGRRLVDSGWEEEAMTCGLHPFKHLKFTENALRREGKYPSRMNYLLPVFNSAWAEDLMGEDA